MTNVNCPHVSMIPLTSGIPATRGARRIEEWRIALDVRTSLISTGLSSKSVFFLATVTFQHPAHHACKNRSLLHCANFSSFPIVAEIPRPISAAWRANSDRRGFPLSPSFWVSPSSLWEPGFWVWRRLAAVTMWRNSAVRSFIATAILGGGVWVR